MLIGYLLLVVSMFTNAPVKPDLSNDRFEVYLQKDHSWVLREKATGQNWRFRPEFIVLTSTEDPKMAMRPAGIRNVMYNAVTWQPSKLDAQDALKQTRIGEDVVGDGFDDNILKGKTDSRTVDVFKAGNITRHAANRIAKTQTRISFSFPETNLLRISAMLTFDGDDIFPTLAYTIEPKKQMYYSVAYTGAPEYRIEDVSEIWQPLVWQEKRFPEKSYMTLAFQCPIPSTIVCASGACTGVVADPNEFAFQPLPLLDNSRFGIALRTEDGKAKPMLFAPVLGGSESLMKPGSPFTFSTQLYVGVTTVAGAFEEIARDIYDFRDHRQNTTHTLNETLDNMLAYGMSAYSLFIDSLKGCAYSTDVPGAVKNVSSLNPLQMALLTDNEDIYWKRAYPIMEFLLSREKFLFTLDSTVKSQNPSRKMNGPVAPISELSALYEISGKKSQALLDLARQEFTTSRIRNLSVAEKGNSWQNALALHQSTGDKQYLDEAILGADQYLAQRVDQPSEDFNIVEKGFFFWNGFTPDWISLFLLYETTGNKRYLDAAQKGAHQYASFVWFAPRIPDGSVVVNEDDKAPMYWYLKSKGHKPMMLPEEKVEAWRVSEIGLTPESSGTAHGHRGIFMTNYAPWMLRIGFLKNDQFLRDIAKAAVIGRYANFPGYHMNTARTTAYEKDDYPLRPFKELSVNSFHFNHIWPHMSILVDYLFTDAFVRSKGQINMPSAYIEGYAYLQSKFYGHESGEFYSDKNVYAWMPPALLTTSSKQLNYLSFRGNNTTYIVFLNQSPDNVTSTVTLNKSLFDQVSLSDQHAKVWIDNKPSRNESVINGNFSVTVNGNGITAVKFKDLNPDIQFQNRFLKNTSGSSPGLMEIKAGNSKAMVLDFGNNLRTFYLYLQQDDRLVKSTSLRYNLNGSDHTLTDSDFPFEFTVRLPEKITDVTFQLRVTAADGSSTAEEIPLQLK